MLTRRVIPCLDILHGRVVKGKRFQNLMDAGDPVDLAARYSEEGADELVILDISATQEGRKPFLDMVARIAREVNIPLTAGGGIRTVEDIVSLLQCGADKVTLNTVLVETPSILDAAAPRVGSQALVAAIDALSSNGGWGVRIRSGSRDVPLDAIEWARQVTERGAGEILVTSIDRDGMQDGYDCKLLRSLSEKVTVPVVASGGAGKLHHLLDAFREGRADAILAAGIFHFGQTRIADVKAYLRQNGILVRP